MSARRDFAKPLHQRIYEELALKLEAKDGVSTLRMVCAIRCAGG